MKYKMNKEGTHIEMKDGHPVVLDGEKEFTIDAIGAADKIATITAESNDRRKRITPLKDTIAALETSKADLQTQVDSIGKDGKAQIDLLKQELNSAWSTKEATWSDEKTSLNKKLFDATIGVQFANSPAVAKLTL